MQSCCRHLSITGGGVSGHLVSTLPEVKLAHGSFQVLYPPLLARLLRGYLETAGAHFVADPWKGACPGLRPPQLCAERACFQASEAWGSTTFLVTSRTLWKTASGMHRTGWWVGLCACVEGLRRCCGWEWWEELCKLANCIRLHREDCEAAPLSTTDSSSCAESLVHTGGPQPCSHPPLSHSMHFHLFPA